MNPLTLNLIQRVPITPKTSPQQSTIKTQGIESDFKTLLAEELSFQNNEINMASGVKNSKINLIKEKIANSYYLKPNISEIIAEKLMNNWT